MNASYLFSLLVITSIILIPSVFTFISPSLSVLYISVLYFSILLITSLFGCPNLLFFPTPMIAISGLTLSKNSSLDELLLP